MAWSGKRLFSLIACLVWLGFALPLQAITCAVLTSPQEREAAYGTLLEQQLTTLPQVKLVERKAIQHILQEQQLQSLLGPADGKQRAAFGQRLRADVLIFVTPVTLAKDATAPKTSPKETAPVSSAAISVLVCDTHRGLRLARIIIPTSKRPEDDVTLLVQKVQQVLARAAQPQLAIYAVPPLVSHDLGFEFDHLKTALPRLVESQLMARPGTVVVELAEARAIADELTLSNVPDIQRQLPVYVLGEYRHELVAGQQQVAMTLTFKRGNKDLARVSQDKVAPATLRTTLLELLTKGQPALAAATQQGRGGTPASTQTASDAAKSEAALLAQRAELYMLVGAWTEALDTYEAALLLDSRQPTWHRQCVRAIGNIVPHRSGVTLGTNALSPTKSDERLSPEGYYMLTLQHLEAFWRQAPQIDNVRDVMPLASVISAIQHNLTNAAVSTPKEREALEQKCMLASWTVLRNVMAERASRKIYDDLYMFTHYIRAPRMPDRDYYAAQLKLAPLLIDHPKFNNFGFFSAYMGNIPLTDDRWTSHAQGLNSPEFTQYLHDLAEAVPTEKMRTMIAECRKGIKEFNDRFAQEKNRPKPTPIPYDANTPRDVTFIPIPWSEQGRNYSIGTNVVATIPGVDFYYGPAKIGFMKTKGVLSPIEGLQNLGIYGVQFDGRYLWLNVQDPVKDRSLATSRVILLDPQTEKIVPIDFPAGQPKPKEIQIIPLAPGKAAVFGYFGRTWLDMATYQPPQAPSMQLLHEFKEMADPGSNEQYKNVDLAFRTFCLSYALVPPSAFPARGSAPTTLKTNNAQVSEPPLPRLLLWRDVNIHSRPSFLHPLVIDFQPLTLSVLPKAINKTYDSSRRVTASDGKTYMIFNDGPPSEHVLRRLDYDTYTDIPLPKPQWNVRDLLYYNQAFHLVNASKWFTATSPEGPWRELSYQNPVRSESFRFVSSHHYGLLCLTKNKIYQVILPTTARD